MGDEGCGASMRVTDRRETVWSCRGNEAAKAVLSLGLIHMWLGCGACPREPRAWIVQSGKKDAQEVSYQCILTWWGE